MDNADMDNADTNSRNKCSSFFRRIFSPGSWDEFMKILKLSCPIVINVCGNAVMNDLTLACNTLFPQTYGRVNKTKGVILQRSVLILLMCCLPCFAVFLNTEHLLKLIGQNPIIAKNSGLYTKVFISGLPKMQMTLNELPKLESVWDDEEEEGLMEEEEQAEEEDEENGEEEEESSSVQDSDDLTSVEVAAVAVSVSKSSLATQLKLMLPSME